MTASDDWGRDPSVRAMRRLFARMESGQKDLLESFEISSHDARLRACREDARDLFERVLSRSAAALGQDEGDAATLSIHCLIRALKEHGLPIPAGAVREDGLLRGLIEEAMK
jgi:hypothetical protein